MSINVTDNVYINNDGNSGGLIHKILAALCILSVIASVAVYSYVEGFAQSENNVVPAFEEALGRGDYDDALSIYRSVQDTVLSAKPEDADKLSS